jgi:hypothetical protein
VGRSPFLLIEEVKEEVTMQRLTKGGTFGKLKKNLAFPLFR